MVFSYFPVNFNGLAESFFGLNDAFDLLQLEEKLKHSKQSFSRLILCKLLMVEKKNNNGKAREILHCLKNLVKRKHYLMSLLKYLDRLVKNFCKNRKNRDFNKNAIICVSENANFCVLCKKCFYFVVAYFRYGKKTKKIDANLHRYAYKG